MASKLDSIPTTWSEADAYLGDKQDRPCGNNTTVSRLGYRGDGADIVLVLHSTYVVRYQANGVAVLNTGGWRTVTTKDRLNRALRGSARVNSVKGRWSVTLLGQFQGATLPFEEGFVVHTGGGAPTVGAFTVVNVDRYVPEDHDTPTTTNGRSDGRIGDRCECGASWDEDTQGFRCAQ